MVESLPEFKYKFGDMSKYRYYIYYQLLLCVITEVPFKLLGHRIYSDYLDMLRSELF